MSKIIWLASYPKSGNTWLRMVLANYLHNSPEPVNINALDDLMASGRIYFDEVLGVEAADLTAAELAYLRPAYYEALATESSAPILMKVHDAFTHTAHGQPLFPKAATQAVLYLIRNPLDVAVSLAHHNHEPIDKTINRMGAQKAMLCQQGKRLLQQLPQTLLDWSGHVQSWLDQTELPLYLLRYEAMKRDPVATFGAALNFAGFTVETERLQRALCHASFANLQQQEQRNGFQERLPGSKAFFRKGECGDWRNELTPAQVERLLHDHGAVMRRFGYLSAADEIL